MYGAVVGGTEFSSTNDSINTANLFYDTLWEYKDTVVKYDYFKNVLGHEEGFYVCEKIKNNNNYIHFFDMHGNEITVFFVEDVEFENCQDIYFEYDVENKKLVMSYLMKNKEEYESMLLSGKD